MKNFSKYLFKRIFGVFLVIFGLVALVIPFFPFAWVAFIGFELLGFRVLLLDNIKKKLFRPREDKDL